ncbi:hypothetical protein I7I50_00321 [Histoplasma capsulatum G186AR]|uniref:Uncharacterized protein n=1 Tax=Ajellomyces capsulatus TaxID=5037 RepID=A0A8H8CUR1_AJECA|nr:hypothetical protein I7I52_07589 [Histoplasma capsulatum]QSS72465.1 hypothetical protein I7I50_00321 [Histoplasma capsulatum G186AR]
MARCGCLPRWMTTSFMACTPPSSSEGEAMVAPSRWTGRPSGVYTPTRRRLRTRIFADLDAPMDFPRTEVQPSAGEGSVVEDTDGPFSAAILCPWRTNRDARSPGPAPDMYTSLKAPLYSENFHSPRKPNVPILKARIGGTSLDVAKKEDARRMVPSPPSVTVRSIFLGGSLSRSRLVYTGNDSTSCTSAAVSRSNMIEMGE